MIKQNAAKSNEKHMLSDFFSHAHRLGNRVNLFGKGINCIDKLHALHRQMAEKVRQIDLSHNAITKLQNIKQFRSLQILNISHNHITDGNQLLKLKKLKNLKTILVKGNAFLKSKQNIVSALSILLTLNSDAQTLSKKQQHILEDAVNKFTVLKIKQSYLAHLQFKIQLCHEYTIQLGQQKIKNFGLYKKIMEQTLQSILENQECRKEVVTEIMQIQTDSRTIHTKNQFYNLFEEKGLIFIENKESQLFELNKKIEDKQNIYMQLTISSNKKRKVHKHEHSKESSSIALTNRSNTKQKIHLNQSQNNTIFSYQQHHSRQKDRLPESRRYSPPPHLKSNEQNYITLGFISEDKFEAYYKNMLMKYNPVYQLLYSPLQSLKNKEKDMLIDILSKHLKEKSRALNKMEKTKTQHAQLKIKYEQIQRDFRTSQSTFLAYKEAMNQRVHRAENSQNIMKLEIQNLTNNLSCMENQNIILQNKVAQINENLSQKRLQQIKHKFQLQKHQQSENIYEKIQQSRSIYLKRKYLSLLHKQAQKHKKFNHKKQLRVEKQKQDILFFYFNQLKYHRAMNKFQAQFINQNLHQLKKQNFTLFYSNSILQVKKKVIQNLLLRKQKQKFLQILSSTNNKKKELNQKLLKHHKFNELRKVKKIFENWSCLIEAQKQQQLSIEAYKWHYKNVLKKSLKNWLIFLKQPIFKQAQLSVDLRFKVIRTFLFKLQSNYFDNKEVSLKSTNVQIFVLKNAKIGYFYRFKGNCSNIITLRQNKLNRLNRQLRSKYCCQFFTNFHQFTEEEKLKRQKIVRIQTASKRKLLQNMKMKKRKIKNSRLFLNRIISKYRYLCISQSFKHSLKELVLENKVECKKRRNFYFDFSLFNQRQLKLRNSQKSLQNLLLSKKLQSVQQNRSKKIFISYLWRPIKIRRKIAQNIAKKYYKWMVKYFSNWRINIHQNQVQRLQQRIKIFGPQIDNITLRQKSLFEEKLVLMEIIESKQKTIKNYMSQLQEAEYKVKTKQNKYKKLKQFCQENTLDHAVNSTLHQTTYFGDASRIPERDVNTAIFEEEDIFDSFRRF